jgi:hypothetical protein
MLNRGLLAFGALGAAAVVVGFAVFFLPGVMTRTSSNETVEAASVTVDGAVYYVSVGRGFAIAEDDLTPYATNVKSNGASVDGATAFTLRGVDPKTMLVMPSSPGSADANGPFPRYSLLLAASLIQGPSPMTGLPAGLCQYADPSLDSAARQRIAPDCE